MSARLFELIQMSVLVAQYTLGPLCITGLPTVGKLAWRAMAEVERAVIGVCVRQSHTALDW